MAGSCAGRPSGIVSTVIVLAGVSRGTSIVFVIVVPSCRMSDMVRCVTACADSGSPSTIGFLPRLRLLDCVEFIVAAIQER